MLVILAFALLPAWLISFKLTLPFNSGPAIAWPARWSGIAVVCYSFLADCSLICDWAVGSRTTPK